MGEETEIESNEDRLSTEVSGRLHKFVIFLRQFWPPIFWGCLCVGMSLYYMHRPLPETEGIGFNVLRATVHNMCMAQRWTTMGMLSVVWLMWKFKREI